MRSTLVSNTLHSTDLTQLIYAGGTFGCYGKPLSPISADRFITEVTQLFEDHQLKGVEWLDNRLIKDSSQLTPEDFVHFYQLILQAYAQHHRRFVLITGTDTLSYLSAFLAEAFAGSDICIIVTGSMRPLFNPDYVTELTLDPQSDAWTNLTEALNLAAHGESGVRVCFAGESWHAQTVQKIHSHDFMAFTGHRRASYPANSYCKRLSEMRRDHWIEDHQRAFDHIVSASSLIGISPIFCLPNSLDTLVSQLTQLIAQPPSGIILMGFGAGNVPYSDTLAKLLDDAYKRGHMVVCASQCPFGGVFEDYAAGSWQYQHGVISGRRLTLPAIYARLLWLHLRFDTPSRRRQRWTYTVNQAQLVKS